MQHARLVDEAPLGVEAEILPRRETSRTTVSAIPRAHAHQKAVQLGTLDPPALLLLKSWSKPLAIAVAWLLALVLTRQNMTEADGALALAAFLFGKQVFSPLQLQANGTGHALGYQMVRLTLEWIGVTALMGAFGLALRLDRVFAHNDIIRWFVLAPTLLVGVELLGAWALRRAKSASGHYVIVGANELGLELARRLSHRETATDFLGFFDFRSPDRAPLEGRERFLGPCESLAAFVRTHGVAAIYIALPMSNAPRIERLLKELRDTTASIYFVPDIFAFDLVQASCLEVQGVPMLSICDTPFYGMNAIRKRVADVVLATAALLLLSPLLLTIATAVKLTSPGPVLFRQRRYGLHGEEIVVYKFRSMVVCEDGPVVVQAIPRDTRVTPVGRLLRSLSLDELPQLINVLQGRMSFVGPRPHAVAHNELYRGLISGYMMRHKVRPGITGWAQVHGLRGETKSVEEMRQRVEYDLDYVRNWSLMLDFRIMLRTASIVLRRVQAY